MGIRPFISITDFFTRAEAFDMLEVLQKARSKRRLGVGVMMSYKTLHDLPTKWSKAFPERKAIANIFSTNEDMYNVLHFADYDGLTKAADIEQALNFAGPNVNAVQLDMIWPKTDLLTAIKRFRNPELEIILQVGRLAMDRFEDGPEKPHLVADHLLKYGNLIDAVLFDRSGGEGLPMNPNLLLLYIRALRARSPLHIVVAGGLGPKTMHLIEPIAEEFPDVSCDAQGQLRPSGNALESRDPAMSAEYLREAAKVLK